MSSFSMDKPIPSCFVKRQLLKWLENFILQKANDLERGKELAGKLSIRLQDSMGTLDLSSVDELPEWLPDDTKQLKIGYLSMAQPFTITVIFSTEAQNPIFPPSRLELSVMGNSARETANGIAQEIFYQIETYRVRQWIKKPNAFLSFALVFLGLNLLWFASFLFNRGYWDGAIVCVVLFFSISAYIVVANMLPHCAFDTLNMNNRFDNVKWLYRLVFGFILTGIGGRFFLDWLM